MAILVLLSIVCFLGSSFANVAPLMSCGLSDGQMPSSDKIKEFLECLREQGHDEELLAELRKPFDNPPPPPNCTSEPNSDEKLKFPYCAGMSDLQCRTLILVLDSLLSVPMMSKTVGAGNLIEKTRSSSDDQEIQSALMNVILARFNDILDEYRRWRVDYGIRQKRSGIYPEAAPHISTEEEEHKKNVNKSTASHKTDRIDTSGKTSMGPATPYMHNRATRMRRQVAPVKIPDNLTPEMQIVLEGYLAWREKNGYGKPSGRWG